MQRVFEPQTRMTADPNAPRLLILDGHNSHTTAAFLEYAKEHDIEVLCLPSHTTHWLQPCDVGVFGPLDTRWKAEVDASWEEGAPVTRYSIIPTYGKARSAAFKKATIQ